MNQYALHLKRRHMALWELYQSIGQLLFPGEWKGDEFRVPATVPYEEALGMKAEAQQHRLWLEERKLPSNDEYVRQSFALNELTGDLDLDAAYDPERAGQLRHVLGKLDSLIAYFALCPSLEDRATYEGQFEAHQRGQAVMCTIRNWLEDGRIVATSAGDQASELVPPEVWGARHVDFDVEAGSASIGPRYWRLDRLEFSRDDIERLLKCEVASSPVGRRSAKQAAEERLIAMMRSEERRPKREIRRELIEEFHISGREVDVIWRRACAISKSGWSRPGRPSRP